MANGETTGSGSGARRRWRSCRARPPTATRGARSEVPHRHSTSSSGLLPSSSANANNAAMPCLHGSPSSGHVHHSCRSSASGVSRITSARSMFDDPSWRVEVTSTVTRYGSGRVPITVAVSLPGSTSIRVTARSATYARPRRKRDGSAMPATATDSSVVASLPTADGGAAPIPRRGTRVIVMAPSARRDRAPPGRAVRRWTAR